MSAIPTTPPSPPGSAPSQSQLSAWLARGRDVLLDLASPLRLSDAILDGRATPSQRRRIVGRLMDAGRARLSDLSRSWADRLAGRLDTLSGWFRAFSDVIAPQHYAAVMAAMGTVDLKPADAKAAGPLVAAQIAWLAGFREDIRAGRQPVWGADRGAGAGDGLGEDGKAARPAAGSFLNRSGMYADASWGIVENVVYAGMVRDGYEFARRRLGGEAHCPQCPKLAELGWVPIRTITPIGATVCRVRCRCWVEYSHTNSIDAVTSPLGDSGRPS